MIIVTEDTVPVACYDDVSPHEALRAYISEIHTLPKHCYLLINNEGTATFKWRGKK
jgi:hypothetical protein